MDYKLYQKSRDAAWQILLDCGVKELPLSVTKINKELNIITKLYHPTDDNDGFGYIKDGQPVIFVSADVPQCRQRFSAAHELGHIILGHANEGELVNREPSSNDNPIEQAANVFASRLLAPACVLWGLGVTSATQIADICNISMQSAEFRMERMRELYARNKFLISPLEAKVYMQFKDYIDLHKFK